MEVPIFETTLGRVDKLLAIGQIALGALGIIWFTSTAVNLGWGLQLFVCLFFAVWIVQAVRGAKTFHLFSDRLVVRRPFTFTTKVDQVYRVEELREVVFSRIKGRFGGPHLHIRANGRYADYRIDFTEKIRNIFISELVKLGVKVSSKM